MLTQRPTTIPECNEQIVRVDACLSEAARCHEWPVECSCMDQLEELHAIKTALSDVPAQREPT